MKIKLIRKKPSEVVSSGLLRQSLDDHGLIVIANPEALPASSDDDPTAEEGFLAILTTALVFLDPKLSEE